MKKIVGASLLVAALPGSEKRRGIVEIEVAMYLVITEPF
jgi:hypothetical protein